MEVSAISVTPNIISTQRADTISSNKSSGKKQLLAPQDQDKLDNSQDQPVSAEEIAKAIQEVNKTLALHNTRLEFSIHEKTKGIIVKVMDEKTGEVIREVPSKKVLDMVAMTWEELGLIVDEKA